MSRKDELRRRIRRAERELARLEALPDFDAMADGTILLAVVGYRGRPALPYVGLKTAGLWSFTESGDFRVYRKNGNEVAEWLTSANVVVTNLMTLAQIEVVNPVVDLGAALLDSIREFPSMENPFDTYGVDPWGN